MSLWVFLYFVHINYKIGKYFCICYKLLEHKEQIEDDEALNKGPSINTTGATNKLSKYRKKDRKSQKSRKRRRKKSVWR